MKHREFIDFFIKIKSESLAYLTLTSYEKCLLRYLPLNELVIDFSLLKAQIIMFDMKMLSDSTKRRNLVVLRQYGKYAVKYGEMDKNYFDDVEKPRKVHIDNFTTGVYSGDEIVSLIFELDRLSLVWKVFFILAIDTGARRGELLALKWSDIDLRTMRILFCRSVYKSPSGLQTKEPKGKRGREIYISVSSAELLHLLMINQKEKCLNQGFSWYDNYFIFSPGVGTSPYNPCTATRTWTRFLKRVRLPRKRLHDLRHTSATLLLSRGIDVRTVCARLGHASLNTTMLYLHALSDKDAALTMNGLFMEATDGI